VNAFLSRRTTAVLASLALSAASFGCGGTEEPGAQEEEPAENASILGSDAAAWSEANEAGNSTEAASELTGYSLDAKGLRISGRFEASAPSYDYFRFRIGTSTRIDVQAFINGVKQDESSSPARLNVNALVDDGYSTLTGNGYFINAGLPVANRDYVLGITGPAGATYTLELKAAAP
jgi:hypothetical protein